MLPGDDDKGPMHPALSYIIAKVLMIRGTIEVTMVDGLVPEYALSAERYFGPEGAKAWLGQVAGMGIKQMVRVAVTPTWVGILDFDKRYPSAIENAIAAMQPG